MYPLLPPTKVNKDGNLALRVFLLIFVLAFAWGLWQAHSNPDPNFQAQETNYYGN